jgi:hypothetical protein
MAVVGKLGNLLNVSAGAGKSVKNGVKISTRLHRNDTKLILLIDPDEESLGIIVEDTSAFGPFTVETTSLQESVSLPILNINILYILEKRKSAVKHLTVQTITIHQMAAYIV